MTIQDVSPFFWPVFPTDIATTPSISSSTFRLNSATDYVCAITQASRDMVLDQIWFRTSSTVTTGCTVDVRIESVSSGLPTNSLWSANTNITEVIPNGGTNTAHIVTLTSSATINKGDTFAIVLRVSSGTPSNCQIACFVDAGLPYFPYIVEYDGTASVITNTAPMMAVHDSTDGWLNMLGFFPALGFNTVTMSSSSFPRQVGNKITIPFTCRLAGAWIWADLDSAGSLILYDSDGATVLGTITLDPNEPAIATAGLHWKFFDTEIELAAGDSYYLVLTSSSATVNATYVQNNLSTYFNANMGGGQLARAQVSTSTPTGTGDWTVSTTDVTFCGLIIDGVDVSAGGGSSEHSFASMS